FTPLDKIMASWAGVGLLVVGTLVFVALVVWFLSTDPGLALRATGDNPQMMTAFGVSTAFTRTLPLALSNGLVGLCGALIAQFQGFADISMGVGLSLVGLASVIVGQAVIPQRRLWLIVGSVALGSILYRLIIYVALTVGLNPN